MSEDRQARLESAGMDVVCTQVGRGAHVLAPGEAPPTDLMWSCAVYRRADRERVAVRYADTEDEARAAAFADAERVLGLG